jgi:putative beta-lysine N-acetyltransferase
MTAPPTAPEITPVSFAEDGAFEARVIDSAYNQRVQVLDYRFQDARAFVGALRRRAEELGFGKVFMKSRAGDTPSLETAGMVREATIPRYFAGEDADVLALFVDPARRKSPHHDEQQQILEKVRSAARQPDPPPLPPDHQSLTAAPDDAEELASLYAEVFASYPYPIQDPSYLVDTMRSHVVYRIVRDERNRVVAAASGETDPDHGNAEMTDFATLPDQRRKGLALHLLAGLEQEMESKGIEHLYTIARARSFGMTRVFYNRGYRFTGTLVNNCNISGGFEDMHVWCRPTSE